MNALVEKIKLPPNQITPLNDYNPELLDLYRQLGHEIVLKQKESNWGDAIIKESFRRFLFCVTH